MLTKILLKVNVNDFCSKKKQHNPSVEVLKEIPLFVRNLFRPLHKENVM